MKKIKYHFNTHTLRFDKVEVPLKVRLLQLFGFIAASIVTGVVIVAILFQYIDSPKEKLLRQQNESYRASYSVIQDRVRQLELQMTELESRDNEVYRSIFESSPIPDSARLKDMEALKEVRMIQNLSSSALLSNMIAQLNNLSVRSAFQDKSYVEVGTMVKNKEKLHLIFGENYKFITDGLLLGQDNMDFDFSQVELLSKVTFAVISACDPLIVPTCKLFDVKLFKRTSA